VTKCANRKAKRAGALRPPFVVTASIAVACGGSTADTEQQTAKPDGGGNVACPAVAPDVFSDCAPALSRCSYTFSCQSGSITVAYQCEEGRWMLEPMTCENHGDSCRDRRLHCTDGAWTDYTGYGGNPPAACPETKPIPGSNCTPPYGLLWYPPCGYPCDSTDSWTMASCVLVRAPASGPLEGAWFLDGVCQGDCSPAELALREYAAGHAECATDSDCVTLYSRCALVPQHCSGAFYVGPSAYPATWSELDAALMSCAASSGAAWECSSCTAETPLPRCSDGRCVAAE
jgi:hypothetical protein